MLTLRAEQMAIFEAQARDRFRARARAHVARCWPREAAQLGPERLSRYVDAAIAEAEARALDAERDVLLHIDLCLLLDRHPDCARDTPWVRALWARSDLPAATRLRLIWRRLGEQTRAAVAAQAAGNAPAAQAAGNGRAAGGPA